MQVAPLCVQLLNETNLAGCIVSSHFIIFCYVFFQAQCGPGVMVIMANLAMVEVMVVKLPRLLTSCRTLVSYVSFVDHSFLWP